MNEMELDFDRKKHILYSKQAEQAIRHYIRSYCGEECLEEIWTQVQKKYAEYLQDIPYLGGTGCRHNAVGGTYDCFAVFALYDVLEKKPALEELQKLNESILLPSFGKLKPWISGNSPICRWILDLVFRMTAEKDDKIAQSSDGSYVMQMENYDRNLGPRFRFTRCPLADFAKKHEMTEIMPAFCNCDYAAMELLHARLIRRQTLVRGDSCDFLIVGDHSIYAVEHPAMTDEEGYLYNE